MKERSDSLVVMSQAGSHRLQGSWADVDTVNRFLVHLEARGFSLATVRAYAFDLLNFGRFLIERSASIGDVVPTDLFDYLDWQAKPKNARKAKVVRLVDRRGAATATMNRRIAAVRGLFEYAVIAGVRADNPVPAARRSTGLRPKARGMLGHISPRRPPTGGRLVRQPRRLPESLESADVFRSADKPGFHRDYLRRRCQELTGYRPRRQPRHPPLNTRDAASPSQSVAD